MRKRQTTISKMEAGQLVVELFLLAGVYGIDLFRWLSMQFFKHFEARFNRFLMPWFGLAYRSKVFLEF